MDFILYSKENKRKISETKHVFIFRHFIDEKEAHVAMMQRGWS